MLYIITGRPGIGKSTLFNKIVEYLKKNGYVVGGIRSPEVRDEYGRRIGFKIIDIMSNREGWLARVNYRSNIKIGKYGVVVDEASKIINDALQKAILYADVIGIDEVGPMELKIPGFKELVFKVLETNKPSILVIHYKLRDPVITSYLNEKAPQYITVTMENRGRLINELPQKILDEIKEFVGR